MSYISLIFFSVLIPSSILLFICLMMIASSSDTTETIYYIIGSICGIITSLIFGYIYKETICNKRPDDRELVYIERVNLPLADAIINKTFHEYDRENIDIPIANRV